MGCGWCGDRCGRQKECPDSWQQDHCPPEITEVQLPQLGTGDSGISRARVEGQKVLITFLRPEMPTIEGILVRWRGLGAHGKLGR